MFLRRRNISARPHTSCAVSQKLAVQRRPVLTKLPNAICDARYAAMRIMNPKVIQMQRKNVVSQSGAEQLLWAMNRRRHIKGMCDAICDDRVAIFLGLRSCAG
jgi:hypothetical protein